MLAELLTNAVDNNICSSTKAYNLKSYVIHEEQENTLNFKKLCFISKGDIPYVFPDRTLQRHGNVAR